MRCLVTGGAGFIGSNLVEALVKRGDEVTVLDDFSVGKMKNLEVVEDRVEVVAGSVCDLKLVWELVSETDVVFHLAAQCLVMCSEDLELAHKVNDVGTFNVCLAAEQFGRKIVYVSSSEIYGTAKYTPMDEQHPTNPQSLYGFTKLVGEQYVSFFNKFYGVPAVIIRPFNTYGKNHREDSYACVVTAFVKRLAEGELPVIYGTGGQSRDLTDVSDVVDGILLLSELSNGEIVNLGTGKAVTIRQLAAMLMGIWGVKPCLHHGIKRYPFLYAEARPNDVHKLEADISLARELGYEPKISLEDGLRKYVEWWREHK